MYLFMQILLRVRWAARSRPPCAIIVHACKEVKRIAMAAPAKCGAGSARERRRAGRHRADTRGHRPDTSRTLSRTLFPRSTHRRRTLVTQCFVVVDGIHFAYPDSQPGANIGNPAETATDIQVSRKEARAIRVGLARRANKSKAEPWAAGPQSLPYVWRYDGTTCIPQY